MTHNDPQQRRPDPQAIQNEENLARHVLLDHHLPTGGSFPFIPPKGWRVHQPLRKNSNGEYIDLKARRWRKGGSRTEGEAWEWDVQLPNGDHLNIDWGGNITHPKPKAQPKSVKIHRGLGGKGKRKPREPGK